MESRHARTPGRPVIAALVASRRDGLSRQGFLELAVALGRFPTDPAQHEAAYREKRGQVLAGRSE